jgi:glycosyltransferase involved in cell wall biosynthesis
LKSIAGDSIRFAGFVPEQELADYYQASDMYFHTARLETFGLSVIEASNNQLPVVSVNEGGPNETVLDGKTGFLAEADPANLSGILLKLSSNPQLRKQLGTAGHEFVRGKYRWPAGADDFLQAVDSVQEGRKSSGL